VPLFPCVNVERRREGECISPPLSEVNKRYVDRERQTETILSLSNSKDEKSKERKCLLSNHCSYNDL